MTNSDSAFRLARDMTDEELATELPCFVQHADAGGRCPELASVYVYGLAFCGRHGAEAGAGARMGERYEAANFFERLRNPHVPALPEAIDDELEALAKRYNADASDDANYHEAMKRAYPEIPEGVRREIDGWTEDEAPYCGTVQDALLDSLATLHKILYIAYADCETWLVENIEVMRQAEAARCSYAMRELTPQS